MKLFKNNHSSYFYTSDGARLHTLTNFAPQEYRQDHPLLVFDYGLVCNPAHFELQYPDFDDTYQILVHDYRGHFNSSGGTPVSLVTLERLAKDLSEILTPYQNKKTIMIGHSMGVNVTLEYAKLFPDSILAMVLISGTVFPPQQVMFNSHAVDLVYPGIKFLFEKYPNICKLFWKNNFLNPVSIELLYRGGFNVQKVPREFVQVYAKRIGELSPEIFLQLFEEMKRHNIISHIEKIKTKALVIAGEKDKVIPLYVQKIIQEKLPHSELFVVNEGSHVPQADFPKLLNKRIQNFIENLSCSL